MASLTYSNFNLITGITLSSADQTRFTSHVEPSAVRELERLLGWPLDPATWSNLYNETGKTQDDCICPDVDADLDPADAVVGKYRLFDWHPADRFLAIDPATAIHKVKLVRNNITYKTFNLRNGEEADEYGIKWVNASTKYAMYLDMGQCGQWPGFGMYCWQKYDYAQIAVDATWGFSSLPEELTRVLAYMIADEFDERSDIQSESRGTHSYSKFADSKQTWLQRYPIIGELAGPNGAAKVRVL